MKRIILLLMITLMIAMLVGCNANNIISGKNLKKELIKNGIPADAIKITEEELYDKIYIYDHDIGEAVIRIYDDTQEAQIYWERLDYKYYNLKYPAQNEAVGDLKDICDACEEDWICIIDNIIITVDQYITSAWSTYIGDDGNEYYWDGGIVDVNDEPNQRKKAAKLKASILNSITSDDDIKAYYTVGDYITFGTYEQDNYSSNGTEEIEWLVLKKEDGKALVISKYALDVQPYNEKLENVTWEDCTLREWLNDDFYNAAFTSSEQSKIHSINIVNENNSEYGTLGGNDTTDKIFLLSLDEAERYFSSDLERECEATAYAEYQCAHIGSSNENCRWWLRSPGFVRKNAADVSNYGSVDCNGDRVCDDFDCVRPAMWISLSDLEKGNIVKNNEKKAIVEKTNDIADCSVGDYITFGTYEQDDNRLNGKEDIEWLVLAKEDDKVLVITKYMLDTQPYNEAYEDVTWEDCTLRKWLNDDFYNENFTLSEQLKIRSTNIVNNDNPKYGTSGGNDTTDKVFLLSIDEVDKYFDSEDKHICAVTEYAIANGAWTDDDSVDDKSTWLWLRSPGAFQGSVAGIARDGSVNCSGRRVDYAHGCVRPAMWISWSNSEEENNEKESIVEIADCSVGDYIVFGTYEQDNDTSNGSEAIEWLVLAKEGNKALVISRYALDVQPYNEEYEEVTWETCTLRKWLNDDFYNKAFTSSEQLKIQNTLINNHGNTIYDSCSGNDTIDKIFLLSSDEVEKYFTSYSELICISTEYAEANGSGPAEYYYHYDSNGQPFCCWWLRSLGDSREYTAVVYRDGGINYYGYSVITDGFCERPAMWISLSDSKEENINNEKETTVEEINKKTDCSVYDFITFGTYEQDDNRSNGKEDIEWLVLAKEGNNALVISKYGLDAQSYNELDEDVTWEDCTLRKWLNDNFYNEAFTSSEQSKIQSTNVVNDDNTECGTSGGKDTIDTVFLLSIEEVEKYFASDDERICVPTEYARANGTFDACHDTVNGKFVCLWWLRSPGYIQIDAAGVDDDGSIDYYGFRAIRAYYCVRPAMWINLES